uniref:Testis expressed 264, ER-phagy receptor n=1 Tax=Sinocyclocheilus grahami TaxID=75366 RepID=A0A672LIC4_SINGR
MWEWQILSLTGFISLVLFLVAVCYILYSGLTTEIHIRTGLPPVRSITVAYKYKVGPYKDCGSLFRESCSIGPKLPCIGIFYDDPKKVPAQKCRYAVGSILSEDAPNEEQQQLYEKHGFRVFSFPEVTHVVTASFPHRTPLSIFLGVQRVYPQLNCYIKVTSSSSSFTKCLQREKSEAGDEGKEKVSGGKCRDSVWKGRSSE